MNELAQIEKQELIDGIDYKAYHDLIDDLLKKGKTTGSNHSEKMLEYTHLNKKRMNKWDKIGRINPSLADVISTINSKQKWIVISEAWCGDAAQNLPFIAKAAALNPNIELQIILRDENPEIMEKYLTNGAKAIPKLIIRDAVSLNDLGTWGPRPEPVQKMLLEMKAAGNFDYNQFSILGHTWYAKNKGVELQNELEKMIIGIHSIK